MELRSRGEIARTSQRNRDTIQRAVFPAETQGQRSKGGGLSERDSIPDSSFITDLQV